LVKPDRLRDVRIANPNLKTSKLHPPLPSLYFSLLATGRLLHLTRMIGGGEI
jgi:hypothetical protein